MKTIRILLTLLLLCSAVSADPADLLAKLRALPSFGEAGYTIPPHVASHMTKDALSDANIPLIVELQRILEVPIPGHGIGSSAVCLRYDTFSDAQLITVAKLQERLGNQFRLGVGGKPWGSDWGPNGKSPPAGTWTPPLHVGWADHLRWVEDDRLDKLKAFTLMYATWDEEEFAQQNVPVKLWSVATETMVLGWWRVPRQKIVPYKCNSWSGIVPLESFQWRTGQLYNLDSPAACRLEMRRLAAEMQQPRAMWLSLNRYMKRNADGTPAGFVGEVTEQMAWSFGMEAYGAGQDAFAPWSKLDLVVLYECPFVDERWGTNFVAYAKGALGMDLE